MGYPISSSLSVTVKRFIDLSSTHLSLVIGGRVVTSRRVLVERTSRYVIGVYSMRRCHRFLLVHLRRWGVFCSMACFLRLYRHDHSLLILLFFDRGLITLLVVIITFGHEKAASLWTHASLCSLDLPRRRRLCQCLLKTRTHLWRLYAVISIAQCFLG